jgi:hypothetical protein
MDPRILNMIHKYGKFYSNALDRYDNNGKVGCDVCNRTSLSQCYGWEEFDVCKKCYLKAFPDTVIPGTKVSTKVSTKIPYSARTKMMDSQFIMEGESYPRTKMRDSQFTTNMRDSQYLCTTDMRDERYSRATRMKDHMFGKKEDSMRAKREKEKKRLSDYEDPDIRIPADGDYTHASFMMDSQYMGKSKSKGKKNDGVLPGYDDDVIDSQFGDLTLMRDSQFDETATRMRDSQFAKKDNDIDPWFRPNNLRQPGVDTFRDTKSNTRINIKRDDDGDDKDDDMAGYDTYANNRRSKFVADDNYGTNN